MKSRGILVLVFGLQLCQPAVGASLFRCEYNGRVEFSDRPCQTVKPKNSCSERDSKDAQHGQCNTPALDAGRLGGTSPVPPVRSANAADWPGRLVLNGISDNPENRAHAADHRHEGANARKISGSSDGQRKN